MGIQSIANHCRDNGNYGKRATVSSQTPSGWYEDPQNPAQYRYWNGNEWTEDRAPRQGQPVAAPSGGDNTGWKIAGAVGGAVLVLGLVAVVADGGDTGQVAAVSASTSATAPDEVSDAVVDAPSQSAPVVETSETPTAPPVEQTQRQEAKQAARFRRSVKGDLRDIQRDIRDSQVAVAEGGEFRLLGNSLELQFNAGQLGAEAAPSSVSDQWNPALKQFEQTLDRYSTALANSAGNAKVLSFLNDLSNQASQLSAIASAA